MTRGKRVQGRRVAGHRPAKARLGASAAGSGTSSAITQPEQEQSEPSRAEGNAAPVAPEATARPDAREEKHGSAWSRFTSAVTTTSTLVTSLAAIAALLFTGLSLQQSRDQNQLAQSGQITDRFNAAVTNLGSANETIRIGGIYALQRIMQDSPRDQPAAIQVLAAFVREQAPYTGQTLQSKLAPALAIDVQTALTVLGTRNPTDDDGARIDLDNAVLANAHLHDADLEDANLHDVDLSDADLSGANLHGADLSAAILYDADFHDAALDSANLEGAGLANANLSGANLTSANLPSADLFDANLTSAILTDAHLWGTSWCPSGKPNHPGGYDCKEY